MEKVTQATQIVMGKYIDMSKHKRYGKEFNSNIRNFKEEKIALNKLLKCCADLGIDIKDNQLNKAGE